MVTRRESIDALLVYELQDDGSPHPADLAVRATGRNTGLRMAPDGVRTTFIRTAGDNREAIDLDALDEKPVDYAGGIGLVLDLAYHPVLPLAACVGLNFSIVCDRETGKSLPEALKSPAAELQNARFHRLWFSADGKGLLIGHDRGDRRAFPLSRRIESLRRGNGQGPPSPGEHGFARPRSACRPRPRAGQGQRPPGGNRRLPRRPRPGDVGHGDRPLLYRRRGRRARRGRLRHRIRRRQVGLHPHLRHCVRQAAKKLSVSYRSKNGEAAAMKTVPAKVLCLDQRKDLALLKIDNAPPLPTVCLAVGDNVESGERVTIIGNPGLGGTILDYTMTEGIVSNPRRELRHQALIQTSAAVNPGSSGGPMFNSKGLVIGLVVLKGRHRKRRVRRAGRGLGAFLATAVNAAGPQAAVQRQWLDSSGEHSTDARYLGFATAPCNCGGPTARKSRSRWPSSVRKTRPSSACATQCGQRALTAEPFRGLPSSCAVGPRFSLRCRFHLPQDAQSQVVP